MLMDITVLHNNYNYHHFGLPNESIHEKPDRGNLFIIEIVFLSHEMMITVIIITE